MTAGIYKIVNSVNEKFYLGSSGDIEMRWRKHLGSLRRGNHHSIVMQRSFIKYGEENFVLIILEQIQDISQLHEREQYYLDTLKCHYNTSKNASGPIKFGSKLSEEHRCKIQKAVQERVQDGWKPKPYTPTITQRNESSLRMKNQKFALGYKCTPEQIENRKRAARISNMKRWYSENWKEEYQNRYGEQI